MNRDALFDAIAAASGLPEASIMWDRQKAKVRDLPAIELRLEGPAPVGALNGEPLEEFDPEGVDGAEIVRGVAFDEEFVLRVQARAVDAGAASALAAKTRRALSFPSILEPLEAAGFVLVESAPVLDVGELVETGWQGRSAFTVRLRVGSVEVDPVRTTFIQSAPVDGTTT